MMQKSPKRVLFNEMTSLLERIEPQRFEFLVKAFPEFENESRLGPDAGEPEIDRKYHEDRAAYASALCSELIPAIYALADKTIARAASLSSSRLIVALLAALGGAATLSSIGIGKEEVARIAGIVTSGIAIINAALESLGKRYTSAETQKAIELKGAALKLSQIRQEMELAIRHNKDVAEIASAVEKCNQVALDLNQRKDKLRLI